MPPKRKQQSTPVCGNPLYLSWIQQWEREAQQRNDKNIRFIYKKAADSLAKHPTPFVYPHEASILSGIGPKIVTRLEKRWMEHCKKNGIAISTRQEQSELAADLLDSAPIVKKSRSSKPYVPRHRSGGFALLLGLLELELTGQTATRATLKRVAQPYADMSFDTAEPGTRYTAWSSMNLLLSKALVVAIGRPLMYSLTSEGQLLAEQLARTEGLFKDELACQKDKVTMETTTTTDVPLDAANNFSLEQTLSNELDSGTDQTNNNVLMTKSNTKNIPFTCLFLNVNDEPVQHRDQAERLIDPISGKIHYRICFKALLAVHPVTTLLFRKSKWDKHLDMWTGYIDENNCSLITISSINNSIINEQDIGITGNLLSSTVANSATSGSSIDLTAMPGTFEVILLLDNRELNRRKDSKCIQKGLEKQDINVEVRALPLGDTLWIARGKTSTGHRVELLLDVVLERKEIDDLIASIKDGRYHEQKHRLERCGLPHIIYLVEGYTAEAARRFDQDQIDGILAAVQVSNGFFLKKTRNIDETVDYLTAITRYLKSEFNGKHLHMVTIDGDDFEQMNSQRQTFNSKSKREMRLLNYDDYATMSKKTLPQSINYTTVLMLMAIKGVSAEKANIIARKYPSPQSILKALLSISDESMRQQLFVHQDELVPRRRIGLELSTRIAQYWLGES
ncbi:hypothetical protein BDF19DRAFT_443380 [Syncephalis fuscata]|nr:hypothetical protein BDF19DRAFT_443380 [Syncephalis fuscata]